MKADLVDITLILDRSGSMASIKTDAEGGMNTFIAEQQKLPGEAMFSLVQFDTEYEVVHAGLAIKAVPPLILLPRGGTALWDAIGRTINRTGARLGALPEADRPGKVIMAILTDGAENSSKEFTAERVKAMIAHQREQYQWEFMYLGANQDAMAVARVVGISAANAMNFAANTRGVAAAFQASARAVGNYRSGGSAAYTPEERQEQEKHGVKKS